MRLLRRLAFILIALFAAGAGHAEDAVRLRALSPKPVYRPGDVIALEMVCAAGMTDSAVVLPGPAEVSDPLPKCPLTRFEISVPRDFVGRAVVSVLVRRGELAGDIFSFEVRSEIPPKELHVWSYGAMENPDECSNLPFDPAHPAPQSLQVTAVQPDGTVFDLCKGAEIQVTTDPPDFFRFGSDDHACWITSKREGSFKLALSYGGLRKEFACRAQNFEAPSKVTVASPPAPPGRRISTAEFIADPSRLERNGQAGECRLVEHWDTGYCYVFSQIRAMKVSEATDARCDDLPALRMRMAKAIQEGHCDARSPRAAVAPVPRPARGPADPPKISIPAFRHDPLKLDHRPMDVGGCRLVEHHTSGFCYIYSLREFRKVSEHTDVPCDDLGELRSRMARAIEDGHCN